MDVPFAGGDRVFHSEVGTLFARLRWVPNISGKRSNTMRAIPAVIGAMFMLALLVQESIPASAFGWKDYALPQLAKPGVVRGGATGATPKIWIPLAQYLHPFRGQLTL